MMLKYISNAYLTGRLTEAGLDSAIGYKWITEEQADKLRLQKNPPTQEPEPEPAPEPTQED